MSPRNVSEIDFPSQHQLPKSASTGGLEQQVAAPPIEKSAFVNAPGWSHPSRELRRDETLQKNNAASRKANRLFAECSDTPENESHKIYLRRKNIGSTGARFGCYKGCSALVIPLYDILGGLRNLQFIFYDSKGECQKEFLYGGAVTGCFFPIGELRDGAPIGVGEGFSTAMSAYEAVEVRGAAVVAAMNCGNIEPVVAALRYKYPRSPITIFGDDDVHNKDNPGRTAAEEAASKHSVKAIFPVFPENNKRDSQGKSYTDFNDLACVCGADFVADQLKGAFDDDTDIPNTPRLKVVNVEDFLLEEISPRERVMEPWLPVQGLTMVYSYRGVGKTHFMLNVAWAIATGGKYLKFIAPKARRVLYIDGEMPQKAMQDRLKAIALVEGAGALKPGYFQLVTPDRQPEGIRDLSRPEGREDLLALCNDVDVIILDNLSTLIRSGVENESESWLPVQEFALKLRREGKSVVFVHHAGKGGNQRGTSRREDVLDTVIKLQKPPEHQPSDGCKFEVHFEKNRGFTGTEAEPFETALIEKDGKVNWKITEIETRNYDRCVEMFNGGMRQIDIAKELGINKSNVSRHLGRAKVNGDVKW